MIDGDFVLKTPANVVSRDLSLLHRSYTTRPDPINDEQRVVWLYVCLLTLHWFTLCLKPITSQSGNLLVPIPFLMSLVAVSSKIMHIPSSSVSILDCWSHKWRKDPSLMVKRRNRRWRFRFIEFYGGFWLKDSNLEAKLGSGLWSKWSLIYGTWSNERWLIMGLSFP